MNNEIRFILYQLPDEEGKVQVVIKDETIWATQKTSPALAVILPTFSKKANCHKRRLLQKLQLS